MGSDSIRTSALHLDLHRADGAVTGYTIRVRRADGDVPAGTGSFGRLVHEDRAGERREFAVRYTDVRDTGRGLHLSGRETDSDGVSWQLEQEIEADPNDPRQIVLRSRATPDAARGVLHYSGPTLRVGDGGFGARKTDALFPGLEYLVGDEPSSSDAFIASESADRHVPHPYKITVPAMAVSCDGIAVGLLWDPNQAYGSEWRHPAAIFSSPNAVEGAENHLLGLFAPGVGRFLAENETEAHRPLGATPDKPLALQGRIIAADGAGAVDVLRAWVDTFGLPRLDPPHSWADNVDLCVRSYLDVAWEPEARGWHHTLSDPWGPRYEARVIAQLWRYSQWEKADPLLAARAREQVRAGLAAALEAGDDAARALPHPELALHHGALDRSLRGWAEQVGKLVADQAEDGSWPWRPDLIAHEEFKTADREERMGRAGDSATGLTANNAVTVLRWAQLSGDAAARTAGLRAVEWCNGEARPEGAQTWELHLHVPDILAVPYLVDANLLAHGLTGEPGYLARAERWAWTGLPFTYLWRALYRPIMAYGTIPVFGATFHDVQPWFGVDVHWNGLVYADALDRLADRLPDGGRRWRAIADGITACGMQQQPRDGRWLGMYPDAFSPVAGDEEYTWWLNPNLIGLNTFERAGIRLDLETVLVDGTAVTSAASLSSAQVTGGTVRLLLDHPVGEASATVIGGGGRPRGVSSEGVALAEVASVDEVASGWQWVDDLALAIVKVPHHRRVVPVEVDQGRG